MASYSIPGTVSPTVPGPGPLSGPAGAPPSSLAFPDGGARLALRTPRLWLIAAHPALAEPVSAFYQRNRAHFAPWDPPTPEDVFTVPGQAQRLEQGLLAFRSLTALRWWMVPAPAPAPPGTPGAPPLPDAVSQVIGSVHFSQIARGAFHCAMLGYALDQAHVGQGLMHEALQASLAEVFSGRVNLHRVQAGYRPENRRSAAVLARLGFEIEGLAKRYLFIDGDWRDHCLTARLNPDFQRPAGW